MPRIVIPEVAYLPTVVEGGSAAPLALHGLFYLDRAQGFQAASEGGWSDREIAKEAGLSPRTVGWYRRLASLPPSCEVLVRAHPKIFDATWAIGLVRRGVLPPLPSLLKTMRRHMSAKQAKAANTATRRKNARTGPDAKAQAALASLKAKMNSKPARDLVVFTRQFLRILERNQILQETDLQRIDEAIWPNNGHQ